MPQTTRKLRRYHHLDGIPPAYRAALFLRRLRYSGHAQSRYARRVAALVPGTLPPGFLDANVMRLLSVDVVAEAVVKQIWRVPLAGIDQDLVLVVAATGRVLTVWVVPRDDPDGLARAVATVAEDAEPAIPL